MKHLRVIHIIGMAGWLGAAALAGCASDGPTVTVTNPSDLDRTGEMVELPFARLSARHGLKPGGFVIRNEKGKEIPYQHMAGDKVIFPVNLQARGRAVYTVEAGQPAPVSAIACGRQYPERLDDIAWENDKSGYRAYGPALQQTGERAYGYDIMVKNVSTPVLEQRYAMELDATARKQIADWRKAGEKDKADSLARAISYHVDHGNGMDCYAVGPTLGGGTAALWTDSAIVYPYCYKEYEIVDKNYARTFDISEDIIKEKEAATRGHIIFPPDEMKILWDNVDKIRFVDWILIQCYMGWRPQELATLQLADVNLDEWYMVAGMKTDAGKNRMVPIHTKIQSLVKRNYDYAVSLGSDALFNDPTATKGGMKITYDKYAGRFDKVMAALKLNPEHRPHDPRMTFITMAKKAGIDPMVVKRLAGHRINDVTEAVYTVRDLEWLRSDIEKIP